MDNPALFFLTVFAGVLILVVLAFAILFALFRRWSGWDRLAELYQATDMPHGQTFNRQTLLVGGIVRYRNSMTVCISPQGLYVATPVPSHPALLIPWREIRPAGERWAYWQRLKVLSIGTPQVSTIAVPGPIFEAAKAYLRT